MKKKAIIFNIFLFIALSYSGPVTAQTMQKLTGDKVRIEQQTLRIKGDSVELTLLFDISNFKLKATQSLMLRPVLTNDSDTYIFPLIVINGKNRQKVYERREVLYGEKHIDNETYYSLIPAGKNTAPLLYQQKVPAQAWMKQAHLEIWQDNCGCADIRNQVATDKFGPVQVKPEPYLPTPHINYLSVAREKVKERVDIVEAYLDFQVDKSQILPYYHNNNAELKKIDETISTLIKDTNLIINHIELVGKASPEAPYEYNRQLAMRRANALQAYIDKNYHPLDRKYYKIIAKGEDWEKLELLVRNSDYSYKEGVLAIIRNEDGYDKKEAQLRKLESGKAFREMNRELFPQLRRIECRAEYQVRHFTLEEARRIIHTNPKQLSLEEIYQVAGSYEEGSDEYNYAIRTATEMFPQEAKTNYNAAAAALLERNTEKARMYMNRLPDHTEYDNNRGALYMLEGNLQEAEKYLLRAKEAGIPEASDNLKELEKKQKNIEEINSFN